MFDKKRSELCPVCEMVQEESLHYLSCSDSVIRQLNCQSWNKVLVTIRKLRTTRSVSAALYNILDGLMDNTTPITPVFPDDDIGTIARQAWEEQQKIGWINVAKGRLSKKWGTAQGFYYQMHPELKTKRWCTPQKWMKNIIRALV